MSETLTFSQTAQIAVTTVDTTTVAPVASSTPIPSAGLFRFQLGTDRMIQVSANFTADIDSVAGSEEFYLLVLSDPSALPTLTSGVLPATEVPSAYSSLFGTASSFEIARKTITAAGTITFSLDVALLTEYFSHALDYTDPWHGSLTVWLCASQGSIGAWRNAALVFPYNTVTYANRDTGRSGPHWGSKSQRCPVTGLLTPRVHMVKDGWREVYVHPLAYDPPEPEDEDFTEFTDPNEDG